MNQLKHTLGEIFEYLLAGVVIALFSPIIALVYIIIGPYIFYDWAWRSYHKDPKADLSLPAIENVTVDASSFTKEGFEEQFVRFAEAIADLSNANMSPLTYEGYDVFEEQSQDVDGESVSMMRTLKTEHAENMITLNLYASYESEEIRYFVKLDGEEWDSPLLPVRVTIHTPHFHINRDFTLYSRFSA
jgi:hypothetical protein